MSSDASLKKRVSSSKFQTRKVKDKGFLQVFKCQITVNFEMWFNFSRFSRLILGRSKFLGTLMWHFWCLKDKCFLSITVISCMYVKVNFNWIVMVNSADSYPRLFSKCHLMLFQKTSFFFKIPDQQKTKDF